MLENSWKTEVKEMTAYAAKLAEENLVLRLNIEELTTCNQDTVQSELTGKETLVLTKILFRMSLASGDSEKILMLQKLLFSSELVSWKQYRPIQLNRPMMLQFSVKPTTTL